MKKILAILSVSLVISSLFFHSVDATTQRIRRNVPATQRVVPYYNQPTYTTPVYYNPSSRPVTSQAYAYSETYIPGYTYYSTPKPGYYYYYNTTSNVRVSVDGPYPRYVDNTTYYNPSYYHAPQNYPSGTYNNTAPVTQTYYYPGQYPYTSTSYSYPGCTRTNIIIGGQEWSACNATDRNASSLDQSGWFFGGDVQSSFLSYNGIGNTLSWQWKQTRSQSWTYGPCASGYRLPTRGEWETAIYYARLNGTTLSNLLNLPYNGAYYGYRDTAGDITLSHRADVNGAYWTSTLEGSTPVVLHLGSSYAGYRTDGTDYTRDGSRTRWEYMDNGLALTQSQYSELANVRCIKN